MKPVSVIGTGQIPVRKQYDENLRQLGARAVRLALDDAGMQHADALYLGNMLSDELQGQKHLAALVADEAGLQGVEAQQTRAATASGAAALRAGFLAVGSGAADVVVVCGVEKMSAPGVTPVLAKALDAEREVPDGATLVSQNARLMALYLLQHGLADDVLAPFAVNAHENACHNPHAMFHKPGLTVADVMASRLISAPIRLYDCAPISEGAAAVVLAPAPMARGISARPVRLLASAAATDRFRIEDRPHPLHLAAARRSAQAALQAAEISLDQIDLVEAHDAFTIMTCLLLEAVGFAAAGEGWRLAADGAIKPKGRLPLSTMGGLKARGHPIGASALYQVCEIVLQLQGKAGATQVPGAHKAMMLSVGGAGVTVLTHLFGLDEGA